MFQTNRAYFDKMIGGQPKHTGRDILRALEKIEDTEGIKAFFAGYVDWYVEGRYERPDAVEMVKANIGHYIKRLPFMKRIKWWWCCGVVYSHVKYS